MRRILRKILLVIFFVLGGIILFAYIYVQMQKPVYSGTFEMPDLDSTVTTYFDDYGVPHIYGKSEKDVFRALGYLHAKERLFQMELVRRVSAGRLSEIFGSKTLEADKFFRMLGLNRKADESVKEFMSNTDVPWKQDMLSYLDGVNEFIEKRRKRFEFLLIGIPKEKYELKDIFLIADFMAFNFEMGFKTDPLLTRISNKYGRKYLTDIGAGINRNPPDTSENFPMDSLISEIESLMPVKNWTGSNCWAVSAERSSSKKTLFENDTHIGVQQPAVWYEAHLNSPGFNFYGSFLAGFPFAPLGHTLHHAWGLTILENDDVDFFREHLDPDDSTQILINGGKEKIKYSRQVIHVKDSADIILNCRETSHGPVCSDVMPEFKNSKSVISVAWTFLKFPDNLPLVTYNFAHASSLIDFRNAVSSLASPGLNVIYADDENNIAWYAAAKFVKRPANVNPNTILDGSGSQDWTGFYDFAQNPKIENPVRGVVLSANNPPNIDSTSWFPGYYAPSDRLNRINQFFHSKRIFDLKDMQVMNTDITNMTAVECSQIMLSKISGLVKLKTQIHERAAEILDRWNGNHNLTDIAPVIYYKFLYHVLKNTFEDELGEKDFAAFLKTMIQKSCIKPLLLNDSSKWWDNVDSKHRIETENLIIEQAFDTCVTQLIRQLGPDPQKWTWRKVHLLEIPHPVGQQKPFDKIFNIGPYPETGGVETINNQGFELTAKGIYKVNLAPALRRTIDFADPENGYSILPSGQSGNFMSRYYHDQTRMYINGQFRKEMMNKEEIMSDYNSILRLIPQR